MKPPISDAFDEPRERDFEGQFSARPRYRQSRAVRSAMGAFIVGCLGSAIAAVVLRVFLPAGDDVARPPSLAMQAPQERIAAPPPPAPARHQTQPKNQLTYRADRSGHYILDADVNGSSTRMMVDTGATAVVLSQADARAAGVNLATLRYNDTVTTAHGQAHVAWVKLREIRLGQLSIDDVSAVVVQDPLDISLLGMSFLQRLSGYSIRDGVLTIEW